MFTALLIIAHISMALAASSHILLTKKEVRSAIGWIGLAWLSPLAGPVIYYIFGINRVVRRALVLRSKRDALADIKRPDPKHEHAESGTGAIPRIVQVGNAVSDHPVVGGNQLDILENGDEAYPAMISAINKAQSTIALSSYIFRMDEIGRGFVEALASAKKRGLDVKVLVDGIGGGFFRCPVISSLNKKNIEAHRFLPGSTLHRVPYLNLRNHKKLLIVDGKTGFVGGMNLGGENQFHGNFELAVRDCQFKFSGPIVQQLLLSFEEDWHFVTNQVLDGSQWWPEFPKRGNVRARVINSGPDHDLGNVESVFSAAIGGAKHHIRIVTPYFLPEDRTSYLLELAALRGVKVELILPRKTDFRLFDWALEGHLSVMALDGITCLRSGGVFDHSKLITVDGVWCAFGSPNWDARSMRLNFEILVECHDHETVERVDQLIDGRVARSANNRHAQYSSLHLALRLRNAAARLLMPYL